MSEIDSDRMPCATSLAAGGNESNSTPALSDLSERDKPWDKHKANADKVAGYYSTSRTFKDYATRINFCADLLDFRLTPEKFEGVYRLKLAAARFCRVRHCPVCQWRRSLMWKAKASKILPKVVQDYPTHRWLFVTLTVKNCQIAELRKTLEWMNKGFKRLSELKVFPAVGWIKSIEVTRGRDGSAHPHIHTLMLVKPSYFSHGYLSQKRWCELWQQSLRIDYQPVLDVKAIKPHNSAIALIPEILKYQTKESDLVADREWFLELTRQLHKTRAVAVGGVLRSYMRELEDEPDDLVGEDGEPEVDEGHVYFDWRRKEKRYRMTSSQE